MLKYRQVCEDELLNRNVGWGGGNVNVNNVLCCCCVWFQNAVVE